MDVVHVIEVALEAVGAASVLAEGLRQALPHLRAWSVTTATNADDAAVEAASIGLGLFTMALEIAHKALDFASLNWGKNKPKPPAAEESGSDDDEPKGDVFP